jgi:sirohydrochlorin ferrochelatase
MGGAGAVKILLRSVEAKEKQPQPYGAKVASAELETHEVQDLADQIDALREATAGHHFRIRVTVEIGEGGKVDQAVLDKVNSVLGQVKAGWHTQ